jgi:hypothetical protein
MSLQGLPMLPLHGSETFIESTYAPPSTFSEDNVNIANQHHDANVLTGAREARAS